MSKDRNNATTLIRQSTSNMSIGGISASSLFATSGIGSNPAGGVSTMTSSSITTTTCSGENEAAADANFQLKKAQLEIIRLAELRDDIELKCKRLDKQVSELLEEKSTMASEIDVLRAKLHREDSNRNDPT